MKRYCHIKAYFDAVGMWYVFSKWVIISYIHSTLRYTGSSIGSSVSEFFMYTFIPMNLPM